MKIDSSSCVRNENTIKIQMPAAEEETAEQKSKQNTSGLQKTPKMAKGAFDMLQ